MTENDLVLKIQDLLKQGKKRKEITEELNITINQYKGLNKKYKFNISIKEDKPYMNKEWLEQQYRKYESAQKIAEICKCSPKVITYWRKKLGIDRAKINYCLRKYVFDENYFEKIDTPEKAYWLGFIMADGCIYHYKDSNKVQFEIKIKSTDGKHLERFAKSIDFDINKIKYGEAKRKNTVCKYAKIRTYNKTFCENLIKHGIFDQKSGKEFFPKMPEEFKRDFIRGFIDGDGSVMIDNNSGVYIYSTSEKIIDEILFFLQSKNFVMYKRTAVYNTYTMYSLRSSKKNNNLKNLLEYLYYDNCIALTRKLKRANILKNRPSI